MAAFSNLETFWQDARYGARMLRKNPGYAAVIILTLALGIGAHVAILTLVNAVLLRPLPFREPDRLVRVFDDLSGAAGPGGNKGEINVRLPSG